MIAIAALIDSNVAIAALANEHQGHAASIALLTANPSGALAMAAHSFAETYSTLTRAGHPAPFGFRPEEAWSGLESLRAITTLVGLTPAQALDAVRSYSARGGIGARLYDALIGEVAVVHGIPTIITWNTRHMIGLFPQLRVVPPPEFVKRHQ